MEGCATSDVFSSSFQCQPVLCVGDKDAKVVHTEERDELEFEKGKKC